MKLKMEDLNFKNNNPGSVQFGNFINYYQFHPPGNRIALLPKDIWTSLIEENSRTSVLDIGCNAGDLTVALYSFLKNCISQNTYSVLGVDIDPVLVARACENNTSDAVTFKCFDIMNDSDQNPIEEFLKFEKCKSFDLVFCFSITMWIHLNHGDAGLKRFLKKVAELSKVLVIEPQPWKCYRTAVRRFKLGKSVFPKFKALKIRQNVEEEIEIFLMKYCGMEKVIESGRSEWGRKLLFFRKKESGNL